MFRTSNNEYTHTWMIGNEPLDQFTKQFPFSFASSAVSCLKDELHGVQGTFFPSVFHESFHCVIHLHRGSLLNGSIVIEFTDCLLGSYKERRSFSFRTWVLDSPRPVITAECWLQYWTFTRGSKEKYLSDFFIDYNLNDAIVSLFISMEGIVLHLHLWFCSQSHHVWKNHRRPCSDPLVLFPLSNTHFLPAAKLWETWKPQTVTVVDSPLTFISTSNSPPHFDFLETSQSMVTVCKITLTYLKKRSLLQKDRSHVDPNRFGCTRWGRCKYHL